MKAIYLHHPNFSREVLNPIMQMFFLASSCNIITRERLAILSNTNTLRQISTEKSFKARHYANEK